MSERKSASERRIEELEREVRKLRHLLSQQMLTGEALEFEACVREDGTPFVALRWDRLAGQLPPEVARAWALDLIRVAEWADLDAAVFNSLKDDMGIEAAAGMLALLREHRPHEADHSAHGKAAV